jgi:hypothetical protein
LDGRRERPSFPFLEEQGALPASEGADHQVNATVTRGVKLSRCAFHFQRFSQRIPDPR